MERKAAWIIVWVYCGLAQANGIGSITLPNGQSFPVLQLGNNTTQPEYFIRADKRFIAITHVRQIARVGIGLVQAPMFEIFLDDGRRVQADVGTMWYQRSTFRDPSTGEPRESFSAVMKERGSSGLLLTVDDHGEPRAIELPDPNAFLDLVLELKLEGI